MRSPARRTHASLAFLVLASVWAVAWTVSAREPQTVLVDFYAVTPDGQPVQGLKADEIQLKIDGRARPITSLTWTAVADAGALDGGAGGGAPPPFASNAAGDGGRAFVIAIDDDSFRPGRERPLRAAVDRFLAALTPRDRVAIVTMPYGGF